MKLNLVNINYYNDKNGFEKAKLIFVNSAMVRNRIFSSTLRTLQSKDCRLDERIEPEPSPHQLHARHAVEYGLHG